MAAGQFISVPVLDYEVIASMAVPITDMRTVNPFVSFGKLLVIPHGAKLHTL